MQDEIIKHSQKIYKTIKNHEHSFLTKVREIFIEIFIIVFAVSLSIWFHSWNEHRHEQREVKEFLTDLKSELEKDLNGLEEAKKEYEELKKSIESIKNSKPDNISINFVTRMPNNANYEGFKSSGKISLIENKKLKNIILEYYQETSPTAYNLDNIFNMQVKTIADESNFEPHSIFEILKEKKYARLLKRLEYYINKNEEFYDFASRQIKEIINVINNENKV